MGKSTREAYGEALVELGAGNEKIVVMDADLGNDQVVEKVLADEKIARFLEKQGGSIVKTIVVKNKLVNLIVK